MAILMRRGLSSDFDRTKMQEGEWAVTLDPDTDRQMVYMCFGAGVVKRIGTWDDLHAELDPIMEATRLYSEAAVEARDVAVASASSAKVSENLARDYADRAFSGTPEGYAEIVDGSKFHNSKINRGVRAGDKIIVDFRAKNLKYNPQVIPSIMNATMFSWKSNIAPENTYMSMMQVNEEYANFTETITSVVDADSISFNVVSGASGVEISDLHFFVNDSEVIMPIPTAQGGIRLNEVVGKSVKADGKIITSAEQGFFDGELLQGAYASQTISVNDRFVSTANIISCKSGDVVGVKYGLPKTSESRIFVSFWNDDTYVSNTIINDFEGDATVPSGINGVRVCIGWSTSSSNKTTPSEALANGISITINGQYAVCVRENNEDSSESKTIFIPTSSPLASVGELHNRIVKVGDKWYEHRVVGSVDLGTLEWHESSAKEHGFVNNSGVLVQDYKTNGVAICERYNVINVRQMTDLTEDMSLGMRNDTFKYLYALDGSCADLSAFTNAIQGVMLYYELATPQYVEITDQTTLYQLESYADSTYISVADGLTTLDVEYGMSDVSATALNGERLAELEKWERYYYGKPKNGAIQILKGTVADANLVKCYRSGNVVQVQMYLTAITTTKNWEVIAKLPYKPICDFYAIEGEGKTVWKIDANGVSRYPLSSNTTINLAFTYITDDDSASAAPMMASEE